MLLTTLNTIGPICIMTLIGYVMGRRVEGLHIETLGTIVIMVATPALIFSTLTSLHVTPQMLSLMAGSAVVCVCIATVLSLGLLFLSGMSIRTFLPSLVLPNSGNMGLPLVLLAFGPSGLKLGISYFFVIALIQHTIGYAIASGSFRVGFLLRQPLIYAVAAVLIVVATGVEVPTTLASTTEILGGMMIPAMLIMLGNSLATLRIADLKPAVITAVGRIIIGVISALAVIKLFDLTGEFAGTVFLMATMPSAIVTYVYAQRFRPDAGPIAGAVVVSTLLTFACLPVLLWFALSLTQ